ncbi:MAG: GGDEF domain-containing protein [Pseudomonadota bacterium]
MTLPTRRWGARFRLWYAIDPAGDWSQLLHAVGDDSRLLSKRRSATLILRARAAALLLAVVTLAFVALDALVFPARLLGYLALARVVASAALLGLGFALRPATGMLQAKLGLALLFAIPTLFLFACNALLSQQELTGAAAAVGAVYTLMPFAMAAAISIFPLAWLEALALGLMVMLVEWGTMATQNHYGLALTSYGVLWLALLVTAMSAVAGMNQLGLMNAIIAQASHDPLTQCYARRAGEELMGMYFGLAQRQRQSLSVVFLDLDHFKDINDRFGHERGDAILAQAGAALRAALRASDLALRWGGEEFLIVLPDTSREQAVAFVERLMAAGLGQRPDDTPLTASLGIASFPSDGVSTWSALVELADQRMYRAKQAGRNRYVDV